MIENHSIAKLVQTIKEEKLNNESSYKKKKKAYNCLYKVTIINPLNISSAKEQWMDMDPVIVFELHSSLQYLESHFKLVMIKDNGSCRNTNQQTISCTFTFTSKQFYL